MCTRLLGWTGLFLFTSLSLGCAQHATFRQQRPALINAPIRRLAVVELKSPREEGGQALAALRAELQHSGRFDLVRQDQLQQAAPAPLVKADGSADQHAAVHAGRRMGLDALLIAQVQFLETDGTVYGSKRIRIGDPEVVATVEYELIDVHTGQLLDKNVAKSEPFKGDLTSHVPGPTDESEVLSRLATSSGIKVAHVLLPYENDVTVRLAHATLGPGSEDVRKGMDEAQAGNWVEARRLWLAAVEANPKNDAAAYNLGVAHEALGEFMLARRSLEAASAENSNSLYREALARIDRAEAEVQLAQMPRPQRFAQRLVPLPPVRPPIQSAVSPGPIGDNRR